jgi:hypothetical protein
MKPPLILTTTEYDLFKPHGEQQAMRPAHVKRLMKSMEECGGFIPSNPIHVYKDGKLLRVIDGHHRLRAAQNLKLPLYYIVGTKEDAWLIAPKNWAVRKWEADAFVNMYASRGLQDYVDIVAYTKKGLPMKFAIALLANETTAGGNQNDAIRNGSFKVKTRKYADEIIHILNSCSPYNNEAKGSVFLSAIAVLVRLEEFNSEVFISRIQTNPRMLVKCATREQMLELIEEIYNFRAREKTNLAFKANAFLSSRSKFKK